MKQLLIIYPHFPPSNLAGVHRPRLIANFAEIYDWHPIILTVKEEFYEEKPDYDLIKTVKAHVEVIKTEAKPVPHPRIYGDIGLRSFRYLKEKALEIIKTRKPDFLWIPIPSFYMAVLGRILHEKTGIPYGIDYIDPWVRDISNRKTIRAVLSNLVARVLEPYSIRKAALISGVAEHYFLPAINRTFKKDKKPLTVAMPYGFDPDDHKIRPSELKFPWDGKRCKPLIYAGAFLPNSVYFAEIFFEVIKELNDDNILNHCLFFVGTGFYSHKNLQQIAKEKKVDRIVYEIKDRFPFLHILNFLKESDGVVVLGTTQKHYTASKIFQSLLSKKPVFAIFHEESTTVNILKEAQADTFLVIYKETESRESFKRQIKEKFHNFLEGRAWSPNLDALEKYSAKAGAEKLLSKIEEILSRFDCK